jgi:hypothetical protein
MGFPSGAFRSSGARSGADTIFATKSPTFRRKSKYFSGLSKPPENGDSSLTGLRFALTSASLCGGLRLFKGISQIRREKRRRQQLDGIFVRAQIDVSLAVIPPIGL